MPSTPSAQTTTPPSPTSGPTLVIVDTIYDEHFFVGPFSKPEDGAAFEAALRGTSIDSFETRSVSLSDPSDVIDSFPVPPEPEQQ